MTTVYPNPIKVLYWKNKNMTQAPTENLGENPLATNKYANKKVFTSSVCCGLDKNTINELQSEYMLWAERNKNLIIFVLYKLFVQTWQGYRWKSL